MKDKIDVLNHGYVQLISCSGSDVDIAMWQLVEKEMPIACAAFKETYEDLFNDR